MNARDWRHILSIAIPVGFLAAALVRLWPLTGDYSLGGSGDDWHTYYRMTLDVPSDPLLRSRLPGAYTGTVHGFLYVYFLAPLLWLSGGNPVGVYLLQSVLLGVGVIAWWRAADIRSSWHSALFLGALLLWAVNDVFQALTIRLLSENLYLVLFPLAWWSFQVKRWSLGACLLGLSVLARPNTILAAVLLLAARGSFWSRDHLRLRYALAGGFFLGLAPLIVRDALVTHTLGFSIITNHSDWQRAWLQADPWTFVGERIAFVFGWTTALIPTYRIRPHWMLVWGACLWTLLWTWRNRWTFRGGTFSPSQIDASVYLLGYLGPVILVADIASYGGRMVAMVIPLGIWFAWRR